MAKRHFYREAFSQIRAENLEWKLRVVVFLVRHDLYGGLYLLYLAEAFLRAVKERRMRR